MKIVITGGQGQLGRDVISHLHEKGHETYPLDRTGMDITNMIEVEEVLFFHRPQVIVHCAAYTKVDLAETETDEAFKINAIGTRNVAVVAEEIGAKLVYISTDYVFSGQGDLPYDEFMQTNPVNTYGKSKLAGEEAVQQFCSRFFILRTSWLYGKYGQNFVKTMLDFAREKRKISVVTDQIGSPTYTKDLVQFIGDIIHTQLYGIYHTTNTGYCSWHDFALAIFKEAGVSEVEVKPVTTQEFPRPARRPANSRLDHRAIRLNNLKDFRSWEEALRDYLGDK